MFTGNIFIDVLLIVVIVVVLIDLLDVPTEFLFKPIWKLFTKIPYNGWSPRPWSCSICMSWWCSLLYLIIVGKVTLLNICIILIMSYFSFIIKDVLIIVQETITKILGKLILK